MNESLLLQREICFRGKYTNTEYIYRVTCMSIQGADLPLKNYLQIVCQYSQLFCQITFSKP